MGRPRGFKPSAEQIAAMIEGRKKAREAKLAAGLPLRGSKKAKKAESSSADTKIVVKITGKEKDAFDFYTPLRDALRPLSKYTLLDRLIREITDKQYWVNPNWVQNKLANYVELRVV